MTGPRDRNLLFLLNFLTGSSEIRLFAGQVTMTSSKISVKSPKTVGQRPNVTKLRVSGFRVGQCLVRGAMTGFWQGRMRSWFL
jgi:hypothetical protein